MILTIDTGNTRTKWAMFNETNAIMARGAIDNTKLGNSPQEWAGCALAVISNVAGEEIATKLKAMLAGVARQHWIVAAAEGYGITNDYQQPESLGSDRWAAMIGARFYTSQHCLVVNAGTALTMDALLHDVDTERCRFAGGVILPGLHAMQQALLQRTHGIGHAIEGQGKYAELPTSTADAVYTGALLAMTGAIEHMNLRLQRLTDSSIHCMISGGDAVLLLDSLRSSAVISDIVVVEDLVLRGLLVIGREIR